MSVATFGYLIDPDRLRSIVGSNDADLRRTIEDRFAEDFRHSEEIVAAHHPGQLTLRQAMGDLIAADVPIDTEVEHLLAFEILCKFLGERLDDDDLLGDLGDLEIPTRLLNSGPPIRLPGFEDRVGFLTPEEVAHEWAELKDADLSHDDEDIEAARVMLRSFIERAHASGKSLVTITC
jgi:hypothetical protein